MRRALAALVAVLTAALAVALVLADRGTTENDRPRSVRAPAGLETGCPEPTTEPAWPEGDLPAGATRVRLCPGPPALDGQGRQLVPDVQGVPELLTTGVDDLVATVNGRDEDARDVDCPYDAGPTLIYWFGYPGGDWRAVGVNAGGCRPLQVGADAERLGGTEVATAFVDALARQRSTSRPPGAARTPPPACGGIFGTSSLSPLPGAPVRLGGAVLCRSAGPFRYRQAEVAPALLARLDAELLGGPAGRPGRCLRSAFNWRTVEGFSVWGDRHTYVIDECGRVHPSYGVALHPAGVGPDPTYLDPALAAAIDRQAYGPVRDVREQ